MLDGGHICRSIVGSQAHQVAATGLVCGLHRRLIVPPRPIQPGRGVRDELAVIPGPLVRFFESGEHPDDCLNRRPNRSVPGPGFERGSLPDVPRPWVSGPESLELLGVLPPSSRPPRGVRRGSLLLLLLYTFSRSHSGILPTFCLSLPSIVLPWRFKPEYDILYK